MTTPDYFDKTCVDCCHYHKSQKNPGTGVCRRDPPIVYVFYQGVKQVPGGLDIPSGRITPQEQHINTIQPTYRPVNDGFLACSHHMTLEEYQDLQYELGKDEED